jgi:hypothetical protein
MQGELRSEYPDMPIQIVGINEVGHESGNPLMTADRTTPVLQDVDANNNGSSDVWNDQWDVTYRDVKILNKQNELVGTVNLTPPAGFDLSDDINYNALKQILTDVAHEQPFWQNPNDPVDVNNDQVITPLDALQCINELNHRRVSDSASNLPLPMPPSMPTPYVDVNGDGLVTPNDALRVINRLNEKPSEAEGESISERASLSDDSPGDSSFSLVAASASRQLELATQPTTQHALPQAGDEWSERRQDDLQIDGDHHPLETISEPTAEPGITFDADSSALPGDAVDSVFQGDADMLLADSFSGSLIRDWSFSSAAGR